MTEHVSSQALGDILDHYADVIEGGNAYAGGSSFRGIPGTRSSDARLRSGDDTPLTATDASADGTRIYQSAGTWAAERWQKSTTPGYFACCKSATESSNVGAARRITAWDATSQYLTVDAFPASITVADVFDIRQGFKRMPNGLDVEEMTGETLGYDRFFHLRLLPGQLLDWHGAGSLTYRGTLELRLRLLKLSREIDAVASVLENITLLATQLVRGSNPDHRDSTYVRALLPGGVAETEKNDKVKVVAVQTFNLIYQVLRDPFL